MSTFKGTVFRFPLRSPAQFRESPLVASVYYLQYSDLVQQLDYTYYRQAKRSLILLRNLKQIEFHVGSRGIKKQCAPSSLDRGFHIRWIVADESDTDWVLDVSEDDIPLEDINSRNVCVRSERHRPAKSVEKDSWLVVTAFLSDKSLQLGGRSQNTAIREVSVPARTINSIPDLGMAAQLSTTSNGILEECSYYSSLPLPAPTGLPVHCHGNFATSSDRRSVRIDGEGGEWNRSLADFCLPHLYFALLERLCVRSQPHYYSYWPPADPAQNVITQRLQLSFWRKVRDSSRQLILSDDSISAPINRTIFGVRPLISLPKSPVIRAVRLLRSSHVVVYRPGLNAGLFRQSDGEQNSDNLNGIQVLNSSFVRELLREQSAKNVLNSFDDASLKEILDFVMENDSIERLIGCYIWRVASGEILKIAPIGEAESKLAYIVDEEGYRLFSKMCPDVLVRPQIMRREILEKWDIGEGFTIRRLDGSFIDKFMGKRLRPLHIDTLQSPWKNFLSNVWNYVSTKKLTITFHETLPSLALSNGESKFVSAAAFDILPIMSSNMPHTLSTICQKLKIFILAENRVEAIKTLIADWDHDERFLECLYRLKGSAEHPPSSLLDPLTDTDIKVYNAMF